MDDTVAATDSPVTPPPPPPPGTEAILTLVTGVLAGVGGVYVGTRSIVITVIAAAAAVTLTAMVLVLPQVPPARRDGRSLKKVRSGR
jgi:hypothetical protein